MDIKKFLNQYKFWIIGIILAVIILPKIFRFLISGSEGEGETTGGGVITPKFQCQSASAERDKPFGPGTKNSNEVCYTQTWLNMYYNAGLKKDGIFGEKTAAALMASGRQVSPAMTLNSLNI